MKAITAIFCAAVALGSSSVYAGQSSGAAIESGDEGWFKCANDGEMCEANGPSVIRYGYTDNWSVIENKGGIGCIAENFAGGQQIGDPFGVETNKWCEVQN